MKCLKQTPADTESGLAELRAVGKRPFGGPKDGYMHIYDMDFKGSRESEAKKWGIALGDVATLHVSGVGAIDELGDALGRLIQTKGQCGCREDSQYGYVIALITNPDGRNMASRKYELPAKKDLSVLAA
jgi:hypothetical protein